MKKLMKSEVCGSRALFTGPTDVLKIAKKPKFSANVHAQYMNSSICLQFRVQKKKKKEEKCNAGFSEKRWIQTGT